MDALAIIIALYLAAIGFGYLLSYLNLRSLRLSSHAAPLELAGAVDADFLERARQYTIENTLFGVIVSLYDNALLFIFLFGLIGPYDSWIAGLGLPFTLSGAAWFLILFHASLILSIPASLYRTFVIEKKHGFNTATPRLWLSDLAKSAAVSTVVTGFLAYAGLYIMKASPGLWWLWIWCFFLLFTVFMMYVSPYVIEPLFNKFEPLEDRTLEEGVKAVALRAGIKVGSVLKVDASRRTRHTNAYFTGIGRVKRIVLFDTLLERLDRGETIAVLAHEAGHWKKRHVLKTMAATEAGSLLALYISYRLLEGDFMNRLFNIEPGSFFTELFALFFLGSIAAFPLRPLAAFVSRRHERQADRFACGLTGEARGMTNALVKLSKDNLSNLSPHPLYVAFHYTHPPVAERIRLLKELPETEGEK